jgi:signal transduction histidine kinase/ABC-type nitrate/sulfonate/bicarbonate transport system substrate-binding protein/FixJ family two-component response regulator
MSLDVTTMRSARAGRWLRVCCGLLILAALPAGELTPVTLQLNYYHQFQFAGYYAADLKGFYRDEGLEVEIREYQAGLDPEAVLLAGAADYAVGDELPFLAWKDGRDLFLLAVIFQRSPYALVVHADSPYISLQDILALPTERMAGPDRTSEPALWLSLKELGRDPATVFTRQRQPGDVERFARGELAVLSCYATNEPLLLHRQGIETRALRLLPRTDVFPGDVLLCRGAHYRHDQAQADGFRRASLRGWSYALTHQDELIAHIISKRPSKAQAHERVHLADEAAAAFEFIDPDRFPVGEVNLPRLQLIAAQLGDAGLPGRVPTELVYHDPPAELRWPGWFALALVAVTAALAALAAFTRRQQRALRQSTAHYQSLVDSAAGYAVIRLRLLPGGRPCFELASRSLADLLGYPLEHYAQDSERFLAQLPSEDRIRCAEKLAHAAEALTPLRCRFRLRHPRHELPRLLLLHATPTQDPRGLFFNGILLDLTNEGAGEGEAPNPQQQELAQRHESLGLLASGVAHDFNNILSAIRGNAELIAPLLPAAGKHRLDRLFQAADRASGLVRQILAYAGRGTVESRPLNLEQEIIQIDALVKHALPTNVRTVVKASAQVPMVMFDPAQFQQVAVNLIVNAAESYQGSPGTVTISLGYDNERVQLRVADTGCGMDSATMARIFEPYYTTKVNGHGLGLAAVEGIIQGVGGTIRCESEPSRGTTFAIELRPCASTMPPQRERTPVAALINSSQYVLVADDDELVREITVEVLSSLGYSCKQAEGGLRCQEILASERETLCAMVIDCRMPDRDGLSIVTALRASGDRLPVILVSGMISSEHIPRDLFDRRTRFLAKPFSQNQLASVIDSLFGSQRGRRPGKDDSSFSAIMVTDIIRQRQQDESRRSLEAGN